MRRSVNKERRIMSTGRGKALKPSTRNLLKAIKRATETTNHTLKNRIPRWWLHIYLTQLAIKKCILHIKLKDAPLTNRGHSKKSANSGHVSYMIKGLIVIMTMLLSKTTRHKTSLVALKGTIKTGFNLINPLIRDRMKTGGRGTRSHMLVCSRAASSSAIACCHF
uniref:Uncharacterized protein n=1 Tax=Arundo donax TaxID=35708 RepID=A0A0A9LEH9_ARUDO